MAPESWLVLTVAAAFLLLGVAGSPLAWAFLHQRRSRLEQVVERTTRALASDVRALDERLQQLEKMSSTPSKENDFIRAGSAAGRTAIRAGEAFEHAEIGMSSSSPHPVAGVRRAPRTNSAQEPTLIAVPSLEGAPCNLDVTVGGLKERYAAIWTLADKGASADVIGRATGQPVGQIELILGLRRRIDGTKSITSHTAHG
jgi:hypothetical protein